MDAAGDTLFLGNDQKYYRHDQTQADKALELAAKAANGDSKWNELNTLISTYESRTELHPYPDGFPAEGNKAFY